MNVIPPISCLTIVPLLGAIAVLALGAKRKSLARGLAFTFAFLALAITLILWYRFNPASGLISFSGFLSSGSGGSSRRLVSLLEYLRMRLPEASRISSLVSVPAFGASFR